MTVTSGGTEAIFDAVAAVVHPGDEVIVLEPCYDSYIPAIELNGGVPVVVPLRLPDYRIDWDAVRDAITPRTRLLMINTPHNPTGAILTAADIAELTDIVQRHPASSSSATRSTSTSSSTARTHESMARHPELAARSFVVGSFGKTYHVTGWKVGYVVAPAALTTELRKVHQFVTFSTHTPVQHAHRRVPGGTDAASTSCRRSSSASAICSAADGRLALHAAALPRQLLSADGLFGDQRPARRRLRDAADEGARRRIDPDVADAVSLDRRRRVVRFCFAKKDETLERAAERLRTIREKG